MYDTSCCFVWIHRGKDSVTTMAGTRTCKNFRHCPSPTRKLYATLDTLENGSGMLAVRNLRRRVSTLSRSHSLAARPRRWPQDHEARWRDRGIGASWGNREVTAKHHAIRMAKMPMTIRAGSIPTSASKWQIHVPMINVHPSYAGGKRCNAMTPHLDIAPTLVALTGLPQDR